MLVVVVLWGSFVIPIHPYGRFRADAIGTVGDAYFEVKDGRVYSVAFPDVNATSNQASRDLLGSYRKENGRWILENDRGNRAHLRVTVWSLQIIETTGLATDKFPRMLSLP